VITSQLYRAALEVCEYLVALDPPRESPEGKLLLLLASALEDYERRVFPSLFAKPKGGTDHVLPKIEQAEEKSKGEAAP